MDAVCAAPDFFLYIGSHVSVDRQRVFLKRGKPVVEDLINMGLPIRVVNVTRKVKVDLFRWLTVCFEQGKVVIPEHEKLLLQLKSIRRRYVKVADDRSRRARLEISHPPNVHDEIVYALALALNTMQKEPKGKLIPIH